ncbi:MAG TPA: methyltransferase domain-containing protein [Terricaulis sp.]|nr:methyltransferase domain-containing protein [Terricaulis sp.]
MDRTEAKKLPAGSPEHYAAYVGPPAEYDFMGATQFRLACALGLRETHRVLDFGCGSLRAGRLLMMYLMKGNYYGIEPNAWLVEQAIEHELGGQGILAVKQPSFDHNADFKSDVFGVDFNFIIAQSIFSHAGPELIGRALSNFKASLRPGGLILATFVPNTRQAEFDGEGWVYPGCVTYSRETIARFAKNAGLESMALPWFHPRQDWHIFAADAADLPTQDEANQHLSGRVLRAPSLRNRSV